MKQSTILIIHGKVQGVGYRYFAKIKADMNGICGFVKNLSDGNVLIEAEGETDQLESFIYACSQGPAFGRVVRVDRQDCPVQGFIGFERR